MDGNREALTSNVLYILAVFQPFMMIGKQAWEDILLQDSINILVWIGFKVVRSNCMSISLTFFPWVN